MYNLPPQSVSLPFLSEGDPSQLPCLPVQRAAMLPSLTFPGHGYEIEQVVWHFPKPVPHADVNSAWNAAASALPCLRLVPVLHPLGTFAQRLLPEYHPQIPQAEAPLDGEDLDRWLSADRRAGVTLGGEHPPWRVTLLGGHTMVFTAHHLIFDGRSLERILQHVATILADRQPLPADDPEELLAALRVRLTAANAPACPTWWQQRLAGWSPADTLPTDPSAVAGLAHRRVDCVLTAMESADIAAAAARFSTSSATLIHAAWVVLLTVWNRSDDVLYGNVRACRHSNGHALGAVAGPFINPLVRRVRTDPSATCGALIEQLRNLQHDERPHELATLATIAAASGVPISKLALETIVSIKDRISLSAAEQLLGLSGNRHRLELHEKPSFILSLSAALHPVINLRLYADAGHFSGTAIDRLAQQLRHLLLTIARAPETPLHAVSVLDPEQHRRLAIAYNATAMTMPRGLALHQPFEMRAASSPAFTALIDGPLTLTYGELDAAANRLAAHLASHGVQPGALVAVRLERSAAQVIALLAVLKAGATYVPLDVQWPIERVQWILGSTRAALLVTDAAHALTEQAQVLVDGEREHQLIAAQPATRIPLDVDETRPAYVIFTSGSTGTPKGVVIDHRGALNTIYDLNARLAVGADDRVLAISSFTFDLSVFDLFGLLAAGGAMVICPPAATRDPARWASLIRHHRITLWNSVPALAEMLVEGNREQPAAFASMRLVMMSGDWIPVTLPSRLRALMPHADQLSLGGATEASIWSILHPIGRLPPEAHSVPYGRPMANQELHVLDRHCRRCPVLVPGDLYIGGSGLAIGYWDDPERTASSFIIAPDGSRLYRTGDQGRFLPSGDIEFLGRTDTQVKLNGFRIELGEIEAVARRYAGVRDSFAMIREDLPGQRQLVLYLVCDGAPPVATEVIAHCRRFLAEYMLPSAVVGIHSLPLTDNGKVDRKSLPRPVTAAVQSQPLTPDETRLAALWERLLGHRPDHPYRTFFECGGDSLAAIRLVEAMRREFSATLTIQQVFETPTLRDLAHFIAATVPSLLVTPSKPSARSMLVCLQPRGSRPPFFLIGEYFDIGRFIVPEQPFYGLFLGASVRVREPQLSFADIARRCLAEIRLIQPSGPLRLGGHCFGAVVAFEIAMQLEALGQQVEHLVMFDPPAPAGISPPPITTQDRLRYHVQRMFTAGPVGSLHHAGRSVRNLYRQWQERRQGIYVERIFADFIPHRIAIAPTLILAREGYLRSIRGGDPRLAWGGWCAGVDIMEATGDHVTFCRAPQVEYLAIRLSELLERGRS